MKQHILPALKLTIFSFVLFVLVYTSLVWVVAQAAPNNGKGETISLNGKIIGFEKEGQLFNQDKYFNSRPSAVDYNAAAGGGSNKGPVNPAYLQQLQSRTDSFLAHNPGIAKAQIPADLLTASGSGLDPHISVQGAYVQVNRIAHVRNIAPGRIKALIKENIEQPLAGLFGPQRVNVLRMNIELDTLK